MIDIIEKTAYFCINQYNHIMKHLRLFAALVLLSFVSTGAMAQSNLLNNLARRAKQNVETRINQGVSKTVNKALEQASGDEFQMIFGEADSLLDKFDYLLDKFDYLLDNYYYLLEN